MKQCTGRLVPPSQEVALWSSSLCFKTYIFKTCHSSLQSPPRSLSPACSFPCPACCITRGEGSVMKSSTL